MNLSKTEAARLYLAGKRALGLTSDAPNTSEDAKRLAVLNMLTGDCFDMLPEIATLAESLTDLFGDRPVTFKLRDVVALCNDLTVAKIACGLIGARPIGGGIWMTGRGPVVTIPRDTWANHLQERAQDEQAFAASKSLAYTPIIT